MNQIPHMDIHKHLVHPIYTCNLTILSPSFQEHRTEIDARAGTFQAFEQFGQQLLARGHYASPEIQQKLEALDHERADLEKAWVQRRMMLDQCLELQVGDTHARTQTPTDTFIQSLTL